MIAGRINIGGVSNNLKPPVIKLSCFEIELKESVNCIKKYEFIEQNDGSWRNGFTVIRKLGNHRYLIQHTIAKTWHVSNIEDLETYCKNFLKLNGYSK